MRILAIRGQNLASLARNFAVELAQSPLADAGLFAITGPVGAGKSTLLDAMCLALFDRTPRLSGRGGTLVGDDELGPGDWLRANDPRTLLRRDAIEGFAEVDFSGRDGVVYRARWSVRRARRKSDGRVQEQEMELREPGRDLVVASGRRSEVLAAIRMRLGLDFQQFCRSVLLAQGEFHAFLRADADERAKLLETLTGASVYRRLSKAAHERRREGEKGVLRLQDQTKQCEVLPQEQRDSLDVRRQQLAQRAQLCKLAVDAAQRHVSWHETAERLRQDESEATVALQAAQRQVAAAAQRRVELELRSKALAAVPRWEVLQQQRAVLRQAESAVTAVAQEIAAARERRRGVASQLARAMTDTLGASAVPSLIAELPRWRSLLERVARAERAGQQAAATLPEATRRAQQTTERQAELQRSLTPLGQRFAAADEVLQQAMANGANEAAQATARAERRAQLAGEKLALHEAQRWHRAFGEHAAEGDRLEQRQGALHAAEQQAAMAAECAETAVREAEQRLQEAQATVQQAERHHGLAAWRSELVDGQPCPLCGSREHDAGTLVGPADLAAARAAVASVERQLVAARETAKRCAGEALAAQRAAADARGAAKAAAVRKSETLAQWREAAVAIGIALDGAGAFLARPEEGDAQQAHAASAHAKCVEQTFGTHTSQLERRERELEAEEQAEQERAAALRRALKEHGEAQLVLQQRRDELVAAERDGRAAEQELREAQGSAERALEALAEVRRELGEACGDDGLATRVEALGATRMAVLTTLHEVFSSVHEAEVEVDRLAGRLAEAERALHEQRKAAAVAEQALGRVLADNKVDENDVAIAFRLGAQALHEEAAALAGLDEAVVRLRAVVQERARQRQRHDEHDRPMLDKDDAMAALEQTRAERADVDKQRSDVQVRLAIDDAARRQLGALLPRLEAAEQELQVWVALDELIGSSGGDAFAVFAQGLTLDLLLLEANRRLAELARRYRLERIGTGELDFVVVDLDMGGNRRSLWSLSGGETFLVSLALALALATLAAEHSRVETLFLDEGFGTLDAQNLEVALAALDSLQATGCQVGVISHVDGFAERIGAVVEIRPEGSGQSRVVVPAR